MTLPVLQAPVDRLGRAIDDLRISVIDRCNLRCTFCMPADREYHFLPREALLSFEELTRVSRVFAGLGVRKIRLTGGEPLLRKDLEVLVGQLAQLPEIEDLALTTNGFLLSQKAESLAAAGLNRVTVSLESLKDDVYGKINGLGRPVKPVLEGIAAAAAAGLGPIKINTVVMKGTNDDEILDLARFCKQHGYVLRFIEFMDVGNLNEWDPTSVISKQEILERVNREMPIEAIGRERQGDVATRYRYKDDGVELGVIASISQPFCGDCSRARLTSDGALYTCLFGSESTDLKGLLRAGCTDEELETLIREVWTKRSDRYSEKRAELLEGGQSSSAPKVEMFRIGG